MEPTGQDVAEVLERATGPRREEAQELVGRLTDLTGTEPVVWAGRILGFGEYRYTYDSGHTARAPLLGYAPGPARHTLYLTGGFAQRWPEELERLGPHRASTACLYLSRLTRVDRTVLRRLLELSLEQTRSEHPAT